MKNRLYARIGFAAGAFLLIGTLALAKSTPRSKTGHVNNASSKQPAGTQNQTGQAKGIAVDHAGGNGVRRMDRGNTGNHPLNESKDKAASKPVAGASTTSQYKDPEDMTTRYRPGNNKTTTKSPVKPKSSAGSSPQ
jgi:hypothetical protein